MKKLFNKFAAPFAALVVGTVVTGCVTGHATKHALRDSLTLYASFDQKLNADVAKGDAKLYGAVSRKTMLPGVIGLPEGGVIEVAKGQGVVGDALRFNKKSESVVFFKGERNVHYSPTNWNGSISFWLKLDPDKDLAPGYCDPIQIAAGSWNNGVFFAEFSKDETPRHFRFALRPLIHIWNPKNVGWEAIPAADRPMVQFEKPPFGRDRWAHVLFTFENANSGQKNGVGKLYLNGEFAGEFRDWDLSVNWKPESILFTIGVYYVGLFDELALFDRALTPAEVKTVYKLKNGLHTVLK